MAPVIHYGSKVNRFIWKGVGLVHSFILGKDTSNKDWEVIFKNGTDAKDDPTLYHSMDVILAQFDVAGKSTLEVIYSLTEADMER